MAISYPASSWLNSGTSSVDLVMSTLTRQGDAIYAFAINFDEPASTIAPSTQFTVMRTQVWAGAGPDRYIWSGYRIATSTDAGSTHTFGAVGGSMRAAYLVQRGMTSTGGVPFLASAVIQTADMNNKTNFTVADGEVPVGGHGVWWQYINADEDSTGSGHAGTLIAGGANNHQLWFTTSTGNVSSNTTNSNVTGVDPNWVAFTAGVNKVLGYQFLVDWNNDGSFGMLTTDVWGGGDPVVIDRGVDTDQLLSPVMAGMAELSLINSPTSSFHPAVNTDVKPGRDIDINVQSTDGTLYGLFRGNLDDITVGDPTEPYVGLTALDGLGRMFVKTISTAVSINITTGTAIGLVLDEVGWPAGRRDLGTGGTIMEFWWEEETPAIEALQKLIDSEGPGARLFVDRDGDIVFHDRHRRFTAAAETTSQATFRNDDSGGTEPFYSIPLEYKPQWRNILNDVTLKINRYTENSTGQVWAYPFDTLTLDGSEVRVVKATGIIAFRNATAPTTDDYTVTAGSVASVALDRTSGQAVSITLTAGAGGATVEGLRLRANSISQSDTVEVNAASTESQDEFAGVRSFRRFAPWMPEADARDVAQEMVNIQSNPNPLITMRVTNLNGTRRIQQQTREIGDKVTVIDNVAGTTGDYTVERKRDVVSDAGLTHDTFFTVRAISTGALGSTEVFILNSTSQGILNVNKLGF